MKIERNKKWLYLGILISVVQPLIGLILGIVLWKTEPDLEKEGKNIVIVAAIVVVLVILLAKSVAPSLGVR